MLHTDQHGPDRHAPQRRAPWFSDPDPAAGVDPAGRTEAMRARAYLRYQALERMREMSVRHAMHAWEKRYRDPLAPYALALLYAQPAARPGWFALRAAT